MMFGAGALCCSILPAALCLSTLFTIPARMVNEGITIIRIRMIRLVVFKLVAADVEAVAVAVEDAVTAALATTLARDEVNVVDAAVLALVEVTVAVAVILVMFTAVA